MSFSEGPEGAECGLLELWKLQKSARLQVRENDCLCKDSGETLVDKTFYINPSTKQTRVFIILKVI